MKVKLQALMNPLRICHAAKFPRHCLRGAYWIKRPMGGLPILALNWQFLKINNASNLLKIHDFSFIAAFTNR